MSRRYVKIAGHSELRRDTESHGIVNVDNAALNKYREEREHKRKLAKIVEEYDVLKNDVGEIKQLLLQILEKKA